MKTYWNIFLGDLLKAIIVLAIPFTLYFHTYFENEEGSLSFFGFNIEIYSHFGTIEFYVYSILTYIINITLLLIWRFSTAFWWKNFIYIPITLFLYQLAKIHLLLDDDYDVKDFMIALGFAFAIVIVFFSLEQTLIRSNRKSYQKNEGNTSTYFGKFGMVDLEFFYSSIKTQITEINKKGKRRKTGKLLQLYYLKSLLEQKIRKNTHNDELNKSRLSHDFLIVILFVLIPFISNVYKFIPNELQVIKVGWFTLSNHGFHDVNALIWYFSLKMCILVPLGIWFITNQKWWKYAILSPILLTSYQLWEAIQDNTEHVDEYEYLDSLPFVLVIVIVLIYLSKIIKYQSKVMDTYDYVSHEIEELLLKVDSKNGTMDSKIRFANLKRNVTEENAKERLELLVKLKNELQTE